MSPIACELKGGCDHDGEITLAIAKDIFRVFCYGCASDQLLYHGAMDMGMYEDWILKEQIAQDYRLLRYAA
jgi:hypothetical protein